MPKRKASGKAIGRAGVQGTVELAVTGHEHAAASAVGHCSSMTATGNAAGGTRYGFASSRAAIF